MKVEISHCVKKPVSDSAIRKAISETLIDFRGDYQNAPDSVFEDAKVRLRKALEGGE